MVDYIAFWDFTDQIVFFTEQISPWWKNEQFKYSVAYKLEQNILFLSKRYTLTRKGLKLIKGNTQTLTVDRRAISFNKFQLLHSY